MMDSSHATTGAQPEVSAAGPHGETAPGEETAAITSSTPEQAATDCFAYGGQMAASLATDHWRAAAASVTGPLHVRKGTPCEDAAAAGARGGWLAAVVCDGAGNAPLGGRGAETAAARIVMELLSRTAGAEGAEPAEQTALGAVVVDALAAARDHLVAIAAAERVAPSALSTTVVGAVWRGDLTMLFHIGDGGAVAVDAANAVLAVSLPPDQEYVNETYFLTDSTWRQWLQLHAVSGVESLLLMSDGVTPFTFDLKKPKTPFVNAVLDFLRTRDVGAGALALQRLLDKTEAQQVADDKTFLWAQRVTPPAGETHAADTTVEHADLDR
jgi:hypothetical protein